MYWDMYEDVLYYNQQEVFLYGLRIEEDYYAGIEFTCLMCFKNIDIDLNCRGIKYCDKCSKRIEYIKDKYTLLLKDFDNI
jgi:hypothetical protein